MSEPFLAEIKIISWNFPPKGWAFCNGQFLPINQNQALFSILGTTYGGNGQTNFALPNLQGRTPIHTGSGFNLGEAGGSESVTLGQAQLPAHNHFVMGSDDTARDGQGNYLNAQASPTGAYFWNGGFQAYKNPSGQALTAMAPQTVTSTGGSQPHQNTSPYLVLNFIIALQGIFPTQT